jgi:hypothetical protein
MTFTIFRRAPRSTQIDLKAKELWQSEVNKAVLAKGDLGVAARIARCQFDRTHRPSGWPWRCHSPGCWCCYRTVQYRWWRGYTEWLAGQDTSLVLVPITDEPFTAARRLRRGLRDVRDRRARLNGRWASVAMAGLVDGIQALVLVQHDGLSRHQLRTVLETRWPMVTLYDRDAFTPSPALTVEHAAALACKRRGVEPLRIVVPAQWSAMPEVEVTVEPMPILL